uniref:Ribosomal protein L19 n=1 Tax=Halimeda micronesica TaxID=170426 RepID=A0A386AXE2_9CHLO|nr:ribosomal protein L19 [Halimeda micronesica]
MAFYLEHFDKISDKTYNISVGDSIKVSFKEGRIQFFSGIITKICGQKITLYQSESGINVERIFSYQNPQINNLLIDITEMAVPKRRSKSRKILWRGKASKAKLCQRYKNLKIFKKKK